MTYPVERVQRYIAQAPQTAPGVDWTLTPTGLGTWRVLSLTAILTASAAVANRTVVLVADDQTTTFLRVPAVAAQTAGQVVHYDAFDGASVSNTLATDQLLDWPRGGLVLPQGYRLRSVTGGIDAADQWSSVAAMVEELPSGRQFLITPAGAYQVEEW